jgi:hypothetical protein
MPGTIGAGFLPAIRQPSAFAAAMVILLAAPPTLAQPSTLIRGRIIDALTREPIPIVNVVVTNTPYGAATDSAGMFQIVDLPSDLYVLEFRHVAYQKRFHVLRLRPSEQVTFTVEMHGETIKLPEVDVAATPEEARRLKQTYASTIITAVQIERSGANKLSEILQAYEPGASVSPQARRRRLFSASSWAPYLIYLDGAYVQYISGGLDNIVDVGQIERIEVSRWVGASPNVGPGTSDRVIHIYTTRPRN